MCILTYNVVMYMLVCTNILCMCHVHVDIVHVYMCVSVCNVRTVCTIRVLYLYNNIIIGTMSCTWVQVCVYAVYILCLCQSLHVSPNHTKCTPPLRIR